MKNYAKPILISGLVCGLLSGIPLLQNFNCCCCMWVILGGGLAAYLLVNSATEYPTDGEGALVGMGGGAVGGLIAGLLNFLIFLLQGEEQIQQAMEEAINQVPNLPPEMQDFMNQFLETMKGGFPLILFLGTVFNIFIFSGVGALGGLIGMRIFRPRRFGPFPPGYYPPPGGGAPPSGPGGGLQYIGQSHSSPPFSPPLSVPPSPGQAPPPGSASLLEQQIAQWLITEFKRSTGIELQDPLAHERIRDAASKAAKELLVREEVMIDLPFLAADPSGTPKHLNVTISRNQFSPGGASAPPAWGNP